jgi:flagellar protein FlaJ
MDTKKANVSGFSIDLCDIPEISSGLSVEEEKKRSKKFLLYRKLNDIKDLLFNPYKTIRDEPIYTFFIGIPLGLYYLSNIPKNITDDFNSNFHLALNFTHISGSSIQLISEIQNYFIIFISIVLIPFIIFYEIRARRMRKIDEKMPDLLRNLSNLNGSGILFSNSLKLMAESKMGILTKELKKLKEDMSWGTSTSRVLMKLGNNIKTATSSRVLHTLIKANESTSDLKNVLLVTSEQVKSEEELKKERSSDMAVYVVTIYVAFFVFVFIVYILVLYFFPQSVSFTRSSQEVWYVGIGNESFNMKEYTMLMFHSTLIQAFVSGLVAGKMGQGSVYMGLKHCVSMIMIACVVFMLFI